MKNKLLIFGILVAFFIFGFYLLVGGEITGRVVLIKETQNIEYILDSKISVMNMEKSPNSVVDVEFVSSRDVLIFVELDDCDGWLKNEDDGEVLYFPLGNKFSIGDPLIKTKAQLDLYKTEKYCFVFKNLEHPKPSRISLKLTERDKGSWNIVE